MVKCWREVIEGNCGAIGRWFSLTLAGAHSLPLMVLGTFILSTGRQVSWERVKTWNSFLFLGGPKLLIEMLNRLNGKNDQSTDGGRKLAACSTVVNLHLLNLLLYFASDSQYTYIYIYIHVFRICVYMCVYVCICVFMCVYVCLCVYIYIPLDIHWRFGGHTSRLFWQLRWLPKWATQIFKTSLLMYANYGNLCQCNEMGYYECITILDFLDSSNCGLRSWPVNVNVRNAIKRDTMAANHCPKNLIFHPEICGFLYRLETEWTMISS